MTKNGTPLTPMAPASAMSARTSAAYASVASTRRVLASDAYAAEVRADIEEARAIGVNGVPFFVLDRRYGISGAQPAELFLEALQAAQRDAGAEVVTAAD